METTQENIQYLQRIFNELDLDNNGQLGQREIENLLDRIQYPIAIATFIIRMCDKNNDMMISFDEFIDSIKTLNAFQNEPEKLLKALFNAIDIDNDGFLNHEEIYNFIDCFEDGITHQNVVDVVNHFDLDKDGKLSFPELLSIYKGKPIQYIDSEYSDSDSF